MDLSALPGYVAGFHTTLALRELGGLVAADGRTVRHGLFYRGSALVDLTPGELARVDALGLRFVLDLRASGEVEGRDDYVPLGAEYLCVPGMYDEEGVEVDFLPAGIARLASRIAAQQESFMTGLYASMVFGNPAVHALMEHLVAGALPMYFHCTAGKDRTGVCAAMILLALGVPDDQIVQEFLLTNEYRAEIIESMPAELPPHLKGMGKKQWAKVNGVDERDLRAVFAAIDECYPSREAYLADEFGLDGATLDALRDRTLE